MVLVCRRRVHAISSKSQKRIWSQPPLSFLQDAQIGYSLPSDRLVRLDCSNGTSMESISIDLSRCSIPKSISCEIFRKAVEIPTGLLIPSVSTGERLARDLSITQTSYFGSLIGLFWDKWERAGVALFKDHLAKMNCEASPRLFHRTRIEGD